VVVIVELFDREAVLVELVELEKVLVETVSAGWGRF
jgi:hypothetical protein